jgi:hypothetical protein
MGNPYAEDEGLTPGSPIVSDVMKKVRAKKWLMDAATKGVVQDSAAGVRALPGGMNMNQRKMLKELE